MFSRKSRRLPVEFAVRIDPAVARAFDRACLREGDDRRVAVESLMTLFLLADGRGLTRMEMLEAGRYRRGESHAVRHGRIRWFRGLFRWPRRAPILESVPDRRERVSDAEFLAAMTRIHDGR